MAHSQQILPEWAAPLDTAITNLTGVRDGLAAGTLTTAEDLLDAARTIADTLEALQPTGKNTDGEPLISLVTALVRASRDETQLEGEPATYTQVAEKLNYTTSQRAFDLHSESSASRQAAARERSAKIRAQIPAKPKPDLPGLSMDEAREFFGGVSRTRVKTLASTGLLHSWELTDKDNNPVTVLRSGKQVPQLRYYPHTTGKSAEESAAELGVTVEEVIEMGERGVIGRAKVLAEGTQEPLQTDGEPAWAYWPEHRKAQ